MPIRVPESVLKSANQIAIKQTGKVDFNRLRDLTGATLVGVLGPDDVFEPTEIRIKTDKLNTLSDSPGEIRKIFDAQIKSVREAATLFTRVLALEHGLTEMNVGPSVEQVVQGFWASGPWLSGEEIAGNVVAHLVKFQTQPDVGDEIKLLPLVASKADEYAKAHNMSLIKLAGRFNEGEYFLRIIERVRCKLQEEKEKGINEIKAEAKRLKEKFIQTKDRSNLLSPAAGQEAKLKVADEVTVLATKILELIEKDGAILDREKGHVKSLFQAIVALGKPFSQHLQEPESLDRVESLLKWFDSSAFNRLYAYKVDPSGLNNTKKDEASHTPHPGDCIVGAALSCPDPRA